MRSGMEHASGNDPIRYPKPYPLPEAVSETVSVVYREYADHSGSDPKDLAAAYTCVRLTKVPVWLR